MPSRSTDTYAYDELGNLQQYIDRNGRKAIYSYDELGRETAEEDWYFECFRHNGGLRR